ncbi:MAG: hypothetical protein PVJ97_03890 [Flavobacteriaceae bacterium]|jgi:hypothetical protein
MRQFFRISEFIYLACGFLFTYRVLININEVNNQLYIYILFAALSFGMYFFRRRFRKKIEDRNQGGS